MLPGVDIAVGAGQVAGGEKMEKYISLSSPETNRMGSAHGMWKIGLVERSAGDPSVQVLVESVLGKRRIAPVVIFFILEETLKKIQATGSFYSRDHLYLHRGVER